MRWPPPSWTLADRWAIAIVWPDGHISLMTSVVVELYEALRTAGAPEDKARAAARGRAEHECRFDHVHTELATIRDEIKALERAAIMVKRVAGTNLAGALVMGLQTFVG